MYGPLIDSVGYYVQVYLETLASVFGNTDGYMPFLIACACIGTAFGFVFWVIKLIRKFIF